jgi:hypothetical protein
MAKWYRKILEIDPSLEKTTPIGFRLSQHDRYSLRRNILFAVCGVYGLLFCFIFFNSLRNRRFFDLRYFLKTAGIWGAATVIAELLVLFKDAVLSSGIALKFTTQNASDMNMGLPAVPLSFLDSSNAMLAGIVLVIGLLPVLLVILYASFKKRSSRIVAGMIAVLSAGALWTHFIILTSYDRILDPVAYIVQKRVWFSGELEKMLITDPQKVLRANPVVLKSGNQDLEEFLRVNYPEGLPSGK